MKTISVSVSESDYEAFRRAAKLQHRPIAQLIREAMAFYRVERLPERERLTSLPVLPGHSATGPLPSRHEVYEDAYGTVTEPESAE